MAIPKRDIQKTIRDLRLAHVELDKLVDTELDAFLKALRRGQSFIYRRMSELLAEDPLGLDWRFNKKIQWYKHNWAAIERIASREAGYEEAVKKYLQGYNRMADMAGNMIHVGTKLPRDMTRIPAQWINFVKRRDYAAFAFLQQEALATLDETLLWGAIAGQRPGSLLSELKGSITGKYPWGKKKGLYEWHAGTYARTASHRAVATWQAEKAGELGIEHRVYVGPVVGKTRRFCLQLVGRVFTVAEIEQMDNGQTGNVLIDRGGWNCRHDWDAIDKEMAEQIREEAPLGDSVREEIMS